ncbi:MAG: hypothetical protein ACTHN0_11275 [Aquihabitans sp.]
MNDDPSRTTRLHDALVAVADRHEPDPDAWARIADRLGATTPQLVEAHPLVASPPHHRRTRLLAAAAVVAVLAAIATAIVVARHGSGEGDTSRVTSTPGDDATGWYIPVGLPRGWIVRSVISTRMDDACPCREVVWANADRSQVVIAHRSDAPTVDRQTDPVEAAGDTTFELGDGVAATRHGPVASADEWSTEWELGGQSNYFTAIGIPADAAEPIARALLADPMTDRIPVTGLRLIDEWHEDGEIGRDVQLDVTMQAPSGNPVVYTLGAPRWAVRTAWSHRPTDDLPGQPLATLVDETGGSVPGGPNVPVMRDYLGRWPGATVEAGGMREGSTETGELIPTDDEVEALMSSLRPATTQEWRRFVDQAGNRDRAVTASATLADLIDQEPSAGDRGTATTFASSSATTAVGVGPTTTAPASAGDLADLVLSLSAEPKLASWEDAGVELTVRNPTSSPISDPGCALDHADVALLPLDDATRAAFNAVPAGDPWWSDDGACDGGVTLEPGTSKTIRLVVQAQFRDARYGPLPSGSYEATARVAGIEEPATAPVEVRSQDCVNRAEDYVGLTESGAYALGGERLMEQVRVLRPGADVSGSSEDCDRINLILGDDGRVAYARAF